MNTTDTKKIISYGTHATPFGACVIALIDDAICYLAFTDDNYAVHDELKKRWKNYLLVENNNLTKNIVEQIFNQDYKTKYYTKLQLRGTPFQIKVWEALRAIPYGTTTSYQDVAITIGKPTAIRAVARAIGSNNISWLIPCHRVIGKSGNLTGYRWRIERKKLMLTWEQSNQ